MKSLLASAALLVLLLPAGAAEGELSVPSVAKYVDAAELQVALLGQLQELQAQVQETERSVAELGDLPQVPFDPTSPMPEAPEGQSAAAADGGLIFDNAESRLIYLGNVRMNHPHLRLRAANRLFISLPKNRTKEDTPTQAPPAADPAQQEQQQPAAAPKPVSPIIPAHLTVDSAAVDTKTSRALLLGRAAEPSLVLTRGQDSMVLQCLPNGAPARVVSDAEGNVLIKGSRMIFIWHNEQGEEWKLEAAEGPLLYSGAAHSLLVEGPSKLTTAQGTLESAEHLVITFAAPATPPAERSAPFSAFATMQFTEVAAAEARGRVVLTTPATDTRPAGTARGDYLVYDAHLREWLLGGTCSLDYGAYTLCETSPDSILRMVADGSINIISSAPLSGTYERPAPANPAGATIRGSWRSGNSISYHAAENTVSFPCGFRAEDELASFSCEGTLLLTLEPKADAPAAPNLPGMPSLVIARQGGVRRVQAERDVQLHTQSSGNQPACDVTADTLDATLPTGEATLTAAAGRRAYAAYNGYSLTAQAAAEGAADICLLANGDIKATGEKLTTVLPGEKGSVLAECARELLLQRQAATLTLGENSRIESPDGILTANAPLTAELAEGSSPSRAPAGYPQLSYNFTGLRRASTPAGGTLRTTQASLQCSGPMAIELNPQATTNADPRKNLRSASAMGSVAVAGKDATGRLMRANGDRLDYDPSTGNFYLRGNTVILADRYNTHTASGAGACVTIDPHNNVRITGKQQTTTANGILQQMEQNKKK